MSYAESYPSVPLFSSPPLGVFYTHWSADTDASSSLGALCSYRPEKAPPPFKVKANGGKSELMKDVTGGKKGRYYEGVAYFIKAAWQARTSCFCRRSPPLLPHAL